MSFSTNLIARVSQSFAQHEDKKPREFELRMKRKHACPSISSISKISAWCTL
ncbi:hypothetical protein DsansV1_C01g0005771 [Dioscorea sansibarensis]